MEKVFFLRNGTAIKVQYKTIISPSQVAPKIKERMILKGSLMIGYQKLDHKGKRNFFRMVIHATPPPTKEDMEYVIAEIERCGKDL